MHWTIFCSTFVIFAGLGVHSQGQGHSQGEIRAHFNMSGVGGNIEFQELGINETRVLFNIELERWYRWEIREFPVLTTEGFRCDDRSLGRRIHDLSTHKTILDERLRLRERLDMQGISVTQGDGAILGRSILLTNGLIRACATIQGPEPVSFARLNGHIAGNVQVRKVGTRYAVFTDLFSTRTLIPGQARMKIYRGNVNADIAEVHSQIIDASERCANNRVSSTSVVGDIRNIPISGGGSSARFMTHITPTNARFDFTDGWLKIGEDVDISCANFLRYQPKVVQAVFSKDGVNGALTFRQDDPYKPTEVHVSLAGLNTRADGYHVHLYPLPYKYTTETELCGPSSTGGHFNPFQGAVTDQLGQPLRNQDQMEIGDLSTKHGNLQQRININETYTDLYLPLFGEHSIVGRSIVIHAPGGSRWICANIGYPGAVIVAKAEFNGDVEGTITFVQEEKMPWGDTTVFVQMTDSGGTSESTRGHKYHIHTNRVGNDHMDEQRRCLSTGGHWNPYDVAVSDSTVYRPTCAAHRQGCEAGDMDGRYGETINIAKNPGTNQFFYTDIIALSGAYSVIRRSVTIHQQRAAAARYVCADIVRKLSPVVMTSPRWNGSDRVSTVSGTIRMFSSGLDSHATLVSVNLKGLAQKAGGYHVHNYPLNTGNPGTNVCGTTGGHYNPYDAAMWNPNDSLDRYEVGDLSNKFGMLTNRDTYQLQELDTNLPLSGPYSVVGRSVVIHDPTIRWRCANTLWDPQAMNGTLLQARATFDGEIMGYITFSQIVSIEGDSDVNIEAMLWYRDESRQATVNHNWHVHVSGINGRDCVSAGGHYNPFKKDVSSTIYRKCTEQTPRKCELGDMSRKLGQIAIGTRESPTRYVFNDNFLSLTGKFAVMGRSIVIHFQNSGAPRIACADIAPFGPATEMFEYYIQTPAEPFKNVMAETISQKMQLDESHNIYVRAGVQRGKCTPVTVYFTGHNATAIKRHFQFEFNNPLHNNRGNVRYGAVDVKTCAALGTATISGVLLLASVLLSVLSH